MTDGDAELATERPFPRVVPVRAVFLGFAAAVAVLLGLGSVVGVDDIVAALAGVTPWAVGGVFGVALAWLSAWSLTLHLVLRSLNVETSVARSFLVYANIQFANQITPFSILGSTPLAAFLVSRATRVRYETGFAATASVELINYLPAPALVILGLLFMAVSSVFGTAAELVALTLAGFALLATIFGRAGWRRRRRLQRTLLEGTIAVERRLDRLVPGVPFPDPEGLDERVGSALATFERISRNRRVLIAGLVAATAGWTLQASILWLSLSAVGYDVPAAVPLLVVPLVSITDVVPLPGGVGSVDAALVALVVTTAGVPAAGAAAAALIHRSATFLFPALLGGVATAVAQSGRIG